MRTYLRFAQGIVDNLQRLAVSQLAFVVLGWTLGLTCSAKSVESLPKVRHAQIARGLPNFY